MRGKQLGSIGDHPFVGAKVQNALNCVPADANTVTPIGLVSLRHLKLEYMQGGSGGIFDFSISPLVVLVAKYEISRIAEMSDSDGLFL